MTSKNQKRDNHGRFAPSSASIAAGVSVDSAMAAERCTTARDQVSSAAVRFSSKAPKDLPPRCRSQWVADKVEAWAKKNPSVLEAYQGTAATPMNTLRADAAYALINA